MNDSEDVQRLIRLKRYETPGDEYYSAFIETFKERQRSEMLHRSSRSLLLERVSMWFGESGGAKRFVPAGALAAAAVGLGIYFVAPQREDAASATVAAKDAPNMAVDSGAVLAKEGEIRLKLPQPSIRVPGLAAPSSETNRSLLPASARGGLREL